MSEAPTKIPKKGSLAPALLAAALGTMLVTGTLGSSLRERKRKKDTKKLTDRVLLSSYPNLAPFLIMLDMAEAKKYNYRSERKSALRVCGNCRHFKGGQCRQFDINVPNAGKNNVCDVHELRSRS
jgi:hypothetical protein